MTTLPSSRVWLNSNDDQPCVFDFCDGQGFAFSRTSPDKSTTNEDAAAVVQLGSRHGVFVVADGMGGASAGDRAAKCVVETVIEHLVGLDVNAESNRPQILDAIEKANREVLSWKLGAGSTLVIVEYLRGTLRSFHVGDATALVCSNRGSLKYSTVAHAPVAMAVEAGVMNEMEAITHEDRHLINNCVGANEMKIDLGPILEMAPKDTLILGSDGLFDNLTTDEIVEVIRAGQLDRQATVLLEETRQRMESDEALPSKPDDLTVIGFRQ